MRAVGMAILVATTAGAANAEPAAVTSRTFIERSTPGAGARLEPLPDRLRSGDRVVVVVRAAEMGGHGPRLVTQPIPAGLRFAEARGRRVTLSVDGGRHFGALADLSVPAASGDARPARPGDVTHLRWRVDPDPGSRRSYFMLDCERSRCVKSPC